MALIRPLVVDGPIPRSFRSPKVVLSTVCGLEAVCAMGSAAAARIAAAVRPTKCVRTTLLFWWRRRRGHLEERIVHRHVELGLVDDDRRHRLAVHERAHLEGQ